MSKVNVSYTEIMVVCALVDEMHQPKLPRGLISEPAQGNPRTAILKRPGCSLSPVLLIRPIKTKTSKP